MLWIKPLVHAEDFYKQPRQVLSLRTLIREFFQQKFNHTWSGNGFKTLNNYDFCKHLNDRKMDHVFLNRHILPDPDQHLVKFRLEFGKRFSPVTDAVFFFSGYLCKGLVVGRIKENRIVSESI